MLTSQLATFAELMTMGFAFTMYAGYRWVLVRSREDIQDEQERDGW